MEMKDNLKKALMLLTGTQRKKSIVFIILLLISSFFEILGIGLIFPLIEVISNSENIKETIIFKSDFLADFINRNTNNVVHLFLALFAIIYIVKNIFLIFFYYWQNKFIWSIYQSISYRLLKNYIYEDIPFYYSRISSELLRNVFIESKNFSSLISSFLRIIVEVTIVFSILLVLLFFNPKITLLSLFVVVLAGLGFIILFKKKSYNLGIQRQQLSGYQLKHLQEIFGAVKDIKIKNCEEIFLNIYHKIISKFSRAAYLQSTISELPKIWLEVTFVLLFLFLMILINLGEATFQNMLPSLGLFFVAAFRLIPSVNRILTANQNIFYYLPSMEKIQDDLKNIKEKKLTIAKEKPISFNEKIEIKNINFTYPKTNQKILKNFSNEIKKNSFTLLRGKSGSGKSTLVDLIMGFIIPDKGKIMSDGYDINDSIRDWQKKISYVSQSVFLLDDTIKKNIAFGVDENSINNELVKSSIKLAALENFINSLSGGLKTTVGEKGVRLSGGQIQRIGIARELYRQSDILIFDESTNALDENSENEIMKCLKNISKTKTVIFISHKRELIKYCDHLIELDS